MIAVELGRKIIFNTNLVREMPDFEDQMDQKTIVKIQVENNEDNYYYRWDCGKFHDRLSMIREVLSEYFESNELPDFNDKDDDPFWDPPMPILIGNSYLSLKSLSYMLEHELSAKIFNAEGSKGVRGFLNVRYAPCDKNGSTEDLDDELCIDEPEELLGRDIHFKVQVHSCKELPLDLCKNVYVTYKMK